MEQSSEHPTYVIHSDAEPIRLDRQARIYGEADDLLHAALAPGSAVLDAGCGSGSAARLFALKHRACQITGVDRNTAYLDYARRTAAAEGLTNVQFVPGDVLDLPFADQSFDVVWSKHLLQWVAKNSAALSEFVRCWRRPKSEPLLRVVPTQN